MKIFAGGIATETNTFSPVKTQREDFFVQRGRDVELGRVDYPALDLNAMWGEKARARGDEFIFSLNAWAEPSGTTVRSAYEELRDELLTDLRAAAPVDVVLLMLHGAMIAEGYEDCEEDLIRRARAIVGPTTVIGVELDLHCHLSESLIQAADVIVTYKEYPHIDISDRARELFDLVVATRLGEIRPTMALFDCRMIGFYPTSRPPLREFVDELIAIEQRRNGGVLSISFAHSFPFADLQKVGAKMLVVTDGDHALAQRKARELGLRVYALRDQIGFDSISVPMDVALTTALQSRRAPVVVADQSDNVGSGAPGDATYALQWLLNRGAKDVAMAIFYDPEVVKTAKQAGLGSRVAVRLGGKVGPSSGEPVAFEATVLSLRDDYMHERPQQSGKPLLSPLGDVAALRCGSIDVIVASKRCQCYCPSIFRDLGIDPAGKRLLVAKSTQHFQRGFASVAAELIYMAGPGAAPPDPRRIDYRQLDTRHMYPWHADPLAT